MSFYSKVVFPRLCELFLNNAHVARRRQELLAEAGGQILEIGFGTGLNLACYPEHVRKLTTVDPNPAMHRLALKRVQKRDIEIDQHILGSERLPFAEGSFDCVVSTFTLCSIENVSQALGEVCRVLRPGGKFLFLEHGLSPDPGVERWQRRLNWLQMRLGGGCRLDRNIKVLVGQAFSSVMSEESYLEQGPRTHSYLYRGVAMK